MFNGLEVVFGTDDDNSKAARPGAGISSAILATSRASETTKEPRRDYTYEVWAVTLKVVLY